MIGSLKLRIYQFFPICFCEKQNPNKFFIILGLTIKLNSSHKIMF